MSEPINAKAAKTGWNSSTVSGNMTPRGIWSCMRPIAKKTAIMVETDKQAKGMGVPSKYLDLPDLSLGSMATVTLNLANRVKPQRT